MSFLRRHDTSVLDICERSSARGRDVADRTADRHGGTLGRHVGRMILLVVRHPAQQLLGLHGPVPPTRGLCAEQAGIRIRLRT
jgi:hypothetical protein